MIGLTSVFLFLLSPLFYLLLCLSYWERTLLLLGQKNSSRFQNKVIKPKPSKLTANSQTFIISLQVWKKTFKKIFVTFLGSQESTRVDYRMVFWERLKVVRKRRKNNCLGFIISTLDIRKMRESRQVASQMIPSITAAKGPKKKIHHKTPPQPYLGFILGICAVKTLHRKYLLSLFNFISLN